MDTFSEEFERQRLSKGRSFGLVDKEVKEQCDRVVRLCQRTFHVPISGVAFIDEDEVFVKGEAGLNGLKRMPRYETACGKYTIFSRDVVVISDQNSNDLGIDISCIGSATDRLMFYAGIRLVTDDGFPIAVLCVLDVVPREFGEEDKASLIQLGKFLMDEIELMKKNYELIDARKQAESAHRLKSAFLANMSHEIRTPLTSLLGMIEMLLADPSMNQCHRSTLNLMQECGSSLHQILNDVLDFSKIEANQLRIETVEFEPEILVIDMLKVLQSKARTCDVDLHLTYTKANKRCFLNKKALGDPTRLRQVFWNLTDNAIKFTPPTGGDVCVKVQECESMEEVPSLPRIKLEEEKLNTIDEDEILLYCEIEDCGEGIPSGQLQTIFNPFEQVDSSTTRTHGGTGLGLSIVVNILKLLKGVIYAESQVGQGSRFWFAVKMKMTGVSNCCSRRSSVVSNCSNQSCLSRANSTESDASVCSIDEERSKRILVAEDNIMIRKMVGKRLTTMGYNPTLKCDGQAALDELRRVADSGEDFFDVFLCDMFMPVKDGAATMHEVRTMFPEPAKSLPIIAFTADVLEESVVRYLKCGADAVIGKPVDWKRLEEMLHNPPRNMWKTRELTI
jgi:signal transduction histidine kinase/CheY-like chemotaxis protein